MLQLRKDELSCVLDFLYIWELKNMFICSHITELVEIYKNENFIMEVYAKYMHYEVLEKILKERSTFGIYLDGLKMEIRIKRNKLTQVNYLHENLPKYMRHCPEEIARELNIKADEKLLNSICQIKYDYHNTPNIINKRIIVIRSDANTTDSLYKMADNRIKLNTEALHISGYNAAIIHYMSFERFPNLKYINIYDISKLSEINNSLIKQIIEACLDEFLNKIPRHIKIRCYA